MYQNDNAKKNNKITLSLINYKKNVMKFDKTEPNFFKRHEEIEI